MKFLLDQDVYNITYEFLIENNFDVLKVKEIGCERANDTDILKEGLKRSRIIITRDKDFGSLIFFSKLKCYGIILLRQKPDNIENVHQNLLSTLNEYKKEKLYGSFITIEADKVRIRPVTINQ